MLKTTTQTRVGVIDIEATGLSSRSYPIEVGVVLSNGQHYEALIRPLPHWSHWDERAESIHGINRELLRDKGKDAKTVCQELNALCEGESLYSDCWVYDSPWLTRLFAESGVKMAFRCRAMESILAEHDLAQWIERKQQVALRFGIKPHRALNDATIISTALNNIVSQVYRGKEQPMLCEAIRDRYVA